MVNGQLKIKNFKCFEDKEIFLNRLTVLAGANGNGKSTVVQAMLFLRKTIEETCELFGEYYVLNKQKSAQQVDLNEGFLLSLGNSTLVLNNNLSSDNINISLADNDSIVESKYQNKSVDAELYLELSDIKINNPNNPILKQTFYYLNAERIGPRISQRIHYFTFPNCGFQGENTAQIIASFNYKIKVDENRKHPSNKSPRLESQVNSWLGELIPGASIVAKQNIETLTAQILVENYFTKGNPVTAPNIGFGISYVLPIILTGLIAEKDAIFIVENPEAHLHPSAQSKIGSFLSIIAQSGINVIIETHSDHVLNGIQLSSIKKEIEPSLVTVNYFDQKEDENQPSVENISINEKGELSKWPKGFFDQSQRDMAELFKMRRK